MAPTRDGGETVARQLCYVFEGLVRLSRMQRARTILILSAVTKPGELWKYAVEMYGGGVPHPNQFFSALNRHIFWRLVPACLPPGCLPGCRLATLLPATCCLLPAACFRLLTADFWAATARTEHSTTSTAFAHRLSLSPSSAVYRAIVRSRFLHARQSFVAIRCHCCLYNSAEDHYTEGKSRHIKQQREGANIMWADSGWRVMGSKGNLKDKTKFYRAAMKHDS